MDWLTEYSEKLQREKLQREAKKLEQQAVAVAKPAAIPNEKSVVGKKMPATAKPAAISNKKSVVGKTLATVRSVPLLPLDGESLSMTSDGRRLSRFYEVSLYDMQIEIGYKKILGVSSFRFDEIVDFRLKLMSELPDETNFWKRFDEKYGFED